MGTGQFDEGQDDLGRDLATGLVVLPGPMREPNRPGYEGPSVPAEQFAPDLPDAFTQASACQRVALPTHGLIVRR
jgi:hypothetical protein